MTPDLFLILNEDNEDVFDEMATLEEALQRARTIIREEQDATSILIEHRGVGLVQLVRDLDGRVEEFDCSPDPAVENDA
jgi:hypothetical protein